MKINYEYYNNEKKLLEDAIIKFGFENDRYIYGINDEQNRIGSKNEGEVKIFLNPQT